MSANVNEPKTLTVREFNQLLSDVVGAAPEVKNRWIFGETSDVRQSGNHCYLELVEKDENGANKSRIRAIIWSGNYRSLAAKFTAGAGVRFGSGIKVRVNVSATYHPAYGMSVVIHDIDPSYTAGDALRRRAEILARLTAEGVVERNRRLAWPYVANRIAVISAKGAAGFGDFINQLIMNAYRFRFDVKLFEAAMQGANTTSTVLARLGEIARRSGDFDAVVIIRGGGSTSDLSAFDNYELAAAVANFPLPVIVGIGHERDVTVLDYVANQRVKTPTAAAELLIEKVLRVVEALARAAEKINRAVTGHISASREFLAHAHATLPGTTKQVLLRDRTLLDRMAENMAMATARQLERSRERLERADQLLKVLSPDAVLARGFSLTLSPDGKAVRDARAVPAGSVVTTRLASGSFDSVVMRSQESR